MGKRKRSSAGGVVTLIILGVASLALFTGYVREGESGPLHTVQLGAAELLRPVRDLAGAATEPFDSAADGVSAALGNAEEKERLRGEVAEYREQAASVARLREENQRLRELLDGDRPAYEYSPLARVVAPVGAQGTELIMIDAGTEAGVRPEQPVVTGENTLVGRTTSRVSRNTAEVMLVTDPSFAAGVRVLLPEDAGRATESGDTGEGGSYGEGLLRTSWDGYLGIEYVSLDARAEKGDFVLTSGRAGGRDLLFPPGLLVGTVESASSQDTDQFKKIVVDPAVGGSGDLEDVRVITSWRSREG